MFLSHHMCLFLPHPSQKSYQLCRFFPRLDFISISAYFRLRNTPAGPYPDLEATKTLYEIEAQKIEAWRNIRGLTAKKVLFAEFGIQSKGKQAFTNFPLTFPVFLFFLYTINKLEIFAFLIRPG